jgi:hypothetical protein
LQLSPDGTLLAITTSATGTPTNIYRNGSLIGTVRCCEVGWVDNSRLLVRDEIVDLGVAIANDASLYSPTGTLLGTLPIAWIQTIQPVSTDTVYVYDRGPGYPRNAILSLTSGGWSWASGNPSIGIGAVAGPTVVFASGRFVLAQPH